MHRITRFAFFLGGVLVPRFEEIICPVVHVDSYDNVDLCRFKRQLTLGQLSLEGLCKRMESFEADRDIHWYQEFPSLVSPDQSMSPILEILAEQFELVLLSDYPAPWSQSISKKSPVSHHFEEIVETVSFGPLDSYSDLFSKLAASPNIQPGNTVIVDWNSHRTRAALHERLDAAIFVDAARFYRDLGLWGIVPLLDLKEVN